MSMEHWRNDIEKDSRSSRRKTCPGVTLSTTNLTCSGLMTKPGIRGERRRLTSGAVALPKD